MASAPHNYHFLVLQLTIIIIIIIVIIIIIIRRFIKSRSSAEAEGKGAVHVFNVLAAIIRMFKKMCFEPRFNVVKIACLHL